MCCYFLRGFSPKVISIVDDFETNLFDPLIGFEQVQPSQVRVATKGELHTVLDLKKWNLTIRCRLGSYTKHQIFHRKGFAFRSGYGQRVLSFTERTNEYK